MIISAILYAKVKTLHSQHKYVPPSLWLEGGSSVAIMYIPNITFSSNQRLSYDKHSKVKPKSPLQEKYSRTLFISDGVPCSRVMFHRVREWIGSYTVLHFPSSLLHLSGYGQVPCNISTCPLWMLHVLHSNILYPMYWRQLKSQGKWQAIIYHNTVILLLQCYWCSPVRSRPQIYPHLKG
jgi:hypothetical protein